MDVGWSVLECVLHHWLLPCPLPVLEDSLDEVLLNWDAHGIEVSHVAPHCVLGVRLDMLPERHLDELIQLSAEFQPPEVQMTKEIKKWATLIDKRVQ